MNLKVNWLLQQQEQAPCGGHLAQDRLVFCGFLAGRKATGTEPSQLTKRNALYIIFYTRAIQTLVLYSYIKYNYITQLRKRTLAPTQRWLIILFLKLLNEEWVSEWLAYSVILLKKNAIWKASPLWSVNIYSKWIYTTKWWIPGICSILFVLSIIP